MFSLALISSLLAQSVPCPGLAPNDIEEIRQISERIIGVSRPITFVIFGEFGEIPPDQNDQIILFCNGSNDSTIKQNPDYQKIELDNKEVRLYLKTK